MSWENIIKEKKTKMSFDKFEIYVKDAGHYSAIKAYSMKVNGKPVDSDIAQMIMWLSFNKTKEAYEKLDAHGFELIDEKKEVIDNR